MLATLGTEPQVVTAALDLLNRRGMRIGEARVLHTIAPGTSVEAALERLIEVFEAPGNYPNITFSPIPIADSDNQPLQDVDTSHNAQAAFRFIYNQVREVKKDGRRLHICLAGGRKLLALFMMSAAQLLCDQEDHIWYLHSSGKFLESKRLHPNKDDEAQLIEVPFILWSRLAPAVVGLEGVDDPFDAASQVRDSQLTARLEHIAAYMLISLTSAERRVVKLLVREGLSDLEIAEKLHLSPRTIETHLRHAYAKAADHWELDSVNRAMLIALVNLYYAFD